MANHGDNVQSIAVSDELPAYAKHAGLGGSSSVQPAMSSQIEQSQRLVVNFDRTFSRHATVFNEDETTKLYKLVYHQTSPHMVMHSVNGTEAASQSPSLNEIGTVEVHIIHSRIDFSLHGVQRSLGNRGMFKNGYDFQSRYARSTSGNFLTLCWQSRQRLGYFDLACTDESSKPVAYLSWSNKKTVRLELMMQNLDVGEKDKQRAMDELVLTGLAVMQQRLNNSIATYGVSAATAAIVGPANQ